MHHFAHIGQRLHCESVDLAAVAQLYGTPTYVYSAATMRDNYTRLANAFPGLDVQVCYAVKANSNLAVLRHFAKLGAAFDFVSAGELRRVVAAGSEVTASVFAGVGKSEAEIRLALESAIFAFHVESEPELARINHVAAKLGVKAPVGFRINPDVDALTHAKVTTGKAGNKFGIPIDKALAAYKAAAKLPNIEIRGVQMHIGSQITALAPFVEATQKLAALALELKSRHGIDYISLGGGIGIAYENALASGAREWWDAGRRTPDSGRGMRDKGREAGELLNAQSAASRPLTPEAYGAALAPLLVPLGLKVLLEPGRFLTGNAGVLLSRVEYLKRAAGKNFLILDAAMNDLARPAMYDSYHEIVPLARDTTRPALTADIVGPVCETSDTFAKDRRIQQVGEGEYVALMSAGAYGSTMSSRYNSRPLPAEVLVHGSAFDLVRARESFETTTSGESIPAFLK